VTILGRLREIRGSRLVFADDAAEHARHGDEAAKRWRRRIDDYIERADIHAPPPEPDPADTAPPLLRTADVDTNFGAIVWCTGFRGDFSYLRLPVLDADGNLVHRGGATAAPGLFAIGLPWLRNRASGLIWGVRKDAEAVVAAITAAQPRV
jgi:putative flavoprotein involved in K+ transport